MNPVAVQRGATLLLLLLALVAFVADDAAAQFRSELRPELVVDENGVPYTPPPEAYSNFKLRGLADLAFVGSRGRGSMRMKLSNAAINDYYFHPDGVNWVQFGTPSGSAQRLFQGSIAMVSPRSEWEKARRRLRDERGIESLNNVAGGGYNNVRNITHWSLLQPERWMPADDQLGFVHSGVAARDDGTCADFQNDEIVPGLPLMAASDCPETWGSDQFRGATRSIPFANWIKYFNDVGPENFTWDWWRVPEEYRTDELLGDFQTYGKVVDWASDRLARFGSVMPNGSGAPTEQGWPMGISIYFDAFSFELPTIANTVFWQALVVNESERVWGIGLDYDSLYLGMMHGVINGGNQNAAEYYRPDIGGVIITGSGTVTGCHGARTPTGVTGCQNQGGSAGAFALLVLNSPLGDLRNKLFTQPGSPFYAPNHPNAGDTITFNIGRMCGFGVACWNSTADYNARAGFGYIAGIVEDLLAGRTLADLDAVSTAAWWRIFRNHDYPERTPQWNKWAPPGWDWNKDGIPDTISVPTCLGPENGGPTTGYPCSEVYSDTMPGFLVNAGNNIGGFIGFGPFKLAAGDTTKWTMALVSGPTQASLLTFVDQTIAFYQAGFLRPSAPPAPRVVSVNTTPGDRGRTPGARVQIFLDDSPELFVDEFLLFQAEQLEGTQLAEDNPWLIDSIRKVAYNNLEAIRVYKSCNGGRNFTATSNCFGDPTTDEQGNPVGLGWRPYAVFRADENGRVPNVFTDANVTAGVRYLYSFVAESRGLTVDVLDRDVETGALIPRRLEIAPKLTNPLSTSASDPNVVSVYVPAARQAGARPATVAFTVEDPRTPVEYCAESARPCPVDVQLTSEDVPGGKFRIVFGDSVVVRAINEPVRGANGAVVGRQYRTEVQLYRTVQASPDGETVVRHVYEEQTFTMPGEVGVTTSGGTTTESAEGHSAAQGDTTYVTTTAFNGLTLVTLNASNQPMLVSSTLTGSSATPGTFLGRPDFPGFIVRANANRAGTLVSTTWLEQGTDEDRQLRTGGAPNVTWISASASATGRGYGEYRFDWLAPEFGPTRLFRVNIVNPSETRSAFEQSLSQRQGATTAVGEEIAAAIRASATDANLANITANDLIQVSVPFKVTNNITGREVTLAMLRSSKRDSIPLGSGTNLVNVGVPSDKWVPGEPLIFLETVTTFRTARTESGQTYVVLDASGRPVVHDTLVVTWNQAVVGCESPVTCNPVVFGTPGAPTQGYLPVTPGLEYLRVRYENPITVSTAYEFEVMPPLTGDKVTAVTKADLDNIKVVPNPYVVFSQFEQTNAERKLMFTGLPPRGTISIFTVAGQFVQRLTYTEADLAGNGDLFWDMRTIEDNEIASGLYIFVVEGVLPASGQTVRKTGKFVVIQGS